jgi:hypothetical protein
LLAATFCWLFFHGRTPTVTPSIVLRREGAAGGCYPFGYRDEIVTKTFDHVVSSPNRHPALRRSARELRAEAQAIIAEGLRQSGYAVVAPDRQTPS